MNDKKKKIAVYYIATGDYKILFPDFLLSLDNFFPEDEKIVKVISDGLEEYKTYEHENVKVELCPRINNYPWPIITLYKMWHILENRDDTCDYVCYFNGNSIINPHNLDIFDFNKITVSYHSFDYDREHYNIWPYINISRNSCAYLENKTYEYIQGGFFFGPSKMIYDMCQDIVDMVNYDSRKQLYAQWHDESYLNKWCVDNFNKVDKKWIMTCYKDFVDSNRFIYLRDKNSYDIKKS